MKVKNFRELIAWQKALDQIFIAQRLTYLKEEQVIRLLSMTNDVARLINGLSNSLPQ